MIKGKVLYYAPKADLRVDSRLMSFPVNLLTFIKGIVKSKFSKGFQFLPHIQSECKKCISETIFYIVWTSKFECDI